MILILLILLTPLSGMRELRKLLSQSGGRQRFVRFKLVSERLIIGMGVGILLCSLFSERRFQPYGGLVSVWFSWETSMAMWGATEPLELLEIIPVWTGMDNVFLTSLMTAIVFISMGVQTWLVVCGCGKVVWNVINTLIREIFSVRHINLLSKNV